MLRSMLASQCRSQLSKNAIFCAEDLFLKCGPELNLSQKACDALAGALLDTCASNMPKALRSAAATALEQGVITGPLMKLIPALAVKANAKNAHVAEAAMVFTEKACKAVAAQVLLAKGALNWGAAHSSLRHEQHCVRVGSGKGRLLMPLNPYSPLSLFVFPFCRLLRESPSGRRSWTLVGSFLPSPLASMLRARRQRKPQKAYASSSRTPFLRYFSLDAACCALGARCRISWLQTLPFVFVSFAYLTFPLFVSSIGAKKGGVGR